MLDLFVADDAETVAAAIARAKATGPLLALASPSDGVNPLTGRTWFVGQIGPASELEPPPPFGLLPVPHDGESCVFSPVVTGIGPAPDASRYSTTTLTPPVSTSQPGMMAISFTWWSR